LNNNTFERSLSPIYSSDDLPEVRVHLNPGDKRHDPASESPHITGWVPFTVPRSGGVGEALMGRSTPRIISPVIVVTLTLVSQNSISPYLRTLKKLKPSGTIRKNAIQASSGS
jgi:hypothetical protein